MLGILERRVSWIWTSAPLICVLSGPRVITTTEDFHVCGMTDDAKETYIIVSLTIHYLLEYSLDSFLRKNINRLTISVCCFSKDKHISFSDDSFQINIVQMVTVCMDILSLPFIFAPQSTLPTPTPLCHWANLGLGDYSF